MKKLIKSLPVLAIVTAIAFMATACKGRTSDNVQATGDTVEVNPLEQADELATETDSMNHDAEAVTLPDSIEVPE